MRRCLPAADEFDAHWTRLTDLAASPARFASGDGPGRGGIGSDGAAGEARQLGDVDDVFDVERRAQRCRCFGQGRHHGTARASETSRIRSIIVVMLVPRRCVGFGEVLARLVGKSELEADRPTKEGYGSEDTQDTAQPATHGGPSLWRRRFSFKLS